MRRLLHLQQSHQFESAVDLPVIANYGVGISLNETVVSQNCVSERTSPEESDLNNLDRTVVRRSEK